MELHNWINHLAYVGEELKSLVTFFNSQSSKKWMEREKLSQRFQIIMFDNNVIHPPVAKLFGFAYFYC
ncbi:MULTISPECIES: hypothetical protein [Croceibacter]|uniref:hypothetical protein n=1 Tax=Croceibacter TaxID=216431 RepID=UPI002353428F|nr:MULTISPECIES: hypothetical protein [Croceibacter]